MFNFTTSILFVAAPLWLVGLTSFVLGLSGIEYSLQTQARGYLGAGVAQLAWLGHIAVGISQNGQNDLPRAFWKIVSWPFLGSRFTAPRP